MKKMLRIAMVIILGFSVLPVFFVYLKASEPSQARPPVGYWKFDEGTGTVAGDSSGNGNNGTVHGATWVSGISRSALSFDGSSNYVSVPDSPSLEIGGNEISIEFWMKPTVDLPYSGQNSRMDVFDKGDSYVGQVIADDPSSPNYGKVLVALPVSGGARDVYSATHFWSSSRWYHIAFTYDGNSMRLYVNGVPENTSAASGNVRSSSYQLSIGSHYSGNPPYFKGILDEVAIYDYARTPQQILEDALRVHISDVTWGLGPMGPYYITISCNDSITSFALRKTAKQLSFIIAADDSGFCNITIPRCRLDDPFNITTDETLTTYTMKQNDTSSTLGFTYTSGTHSVKITGTERGYIMGDLNGDGQVNILDIAIVAQNFGHKEENYDP